MNRYSPEMCNNFGSPFADMIEDAYGGYVMVDDVVVWLKEQRNNIPATGEEM